MARWTHDTIVVLDYGSQTSQLITRRLRELHVYTALLPWDTPAENLPAAIKGIVLSGGPYGVYDEDAPSLPEHVLARGVPVLGICYGMQLLTQALGGAVAPSPQREYGPASVNITKAAGPLFKDLWRQINVWMSHGDTVTEVPAGFSVLAYSGTQVAALASEERHIYGVQFHPEVQHTERGTDLLRNFAIDICGCNPAWTAQNFIEQSVAALRAEIGSAQVVCGLSGGVDSAVVATLVELAVGKQLTCIFVDNGLLRQGEAAQVVETFGGRGLHLIAVDASTQFLSDLQGITDPEHKRRIIGSRFIRTFEEAAQATAATFLAQGTLYPDVIESASRFNQKTARTIKTHHNVGGLPADMRFQLLEPLRSLFKDEARLIGETLGLPANIIWRHPSPGPGLAISVVGEVTESRLNTVRQADAIFISELVKSGHYHHVAEAFAVLLPVQSVGVAGDARSFGNVVVLRAVSSTDFMTADWARLPNDLLANASSRIMNEVPGISRVVYDISSKPPATIRWE